MNWKPSLARCFVVSCGLALVGCGSAADSGSEVVTQPIAGAVDANVTLVSLELPGMT